MTPLTRDRLPAEIWRPIPGFEGSYSISSEGRVLSHERIVMRSNGKPLPVPERIMAAKVVRGGSAIVNLSLRGVGHSFTIKVLQRAAFDDGPQPRWYRQHADGGRP